MDDLDDLLRRAMKTLDDQVPSGYFEDLPARTLARVEESMQTQSTGSEQSNPKLPVQEREENSGLHDIRSLAHSTKARLSSKKITIPPIADDIAASGAWKHVALPEPAKMVALPSLDELPSAAQVLEADKQHEATTASTATAKPAFTAWADKPTKKSKTPLFAALGVGLAAAAGLVLYLNHGGAKNIAAPGATVADRGEMQMKSPNATPPAPPMAAATKPGDVTTGAVGGGGMPAGNADLDQPAQGSLTEDKKEAAPAPEQTTETESHEGATTRGVRRDAKGTGEKKQAEKLGTDKTDKTDKNGTPETTKVETKQTKGGDKTKTDSGATGAKKGGGDTGEPNFDDLLKEAGVKEQPKDAKPKLDKKELTGDDFKKGMAGIKGKAAACYKGTQGTALVKLTISPSGQIAKVSVGGQFAGTPEGDCVEAAVRSASFPPWDGAPQSFSYPILLSE